MILLAVVVLFIALAFPFGGTYTTELMSWGNLPATGTTSLCRRHGLWSLGWSAETKGLEQIEAILFVLMPSPVVFTDLSAPGFS